MRKNISKDPLLFIHKLMFMKLVHMQDFDFILYCLDVEVISNNYYISYFNWKPVNHEYKSNHLRCYLVHFINLCFYVQPL